jgi:hypothetical protein
VLNRKKGKELRCPQDNRDWVCNNQPTRCYILLKKLKLPLQAEQDRGKIKNTSNNGIRKLEKEINFWHCSEESFHAARRGRVLPQARAGYVYVIEDSFFFKFSRMFSECFTALMASCSALLASDLSTSGMLVMHIMLVLDLIPEVILCLLSRKLFCLLFLILQTLSICLSSGSPSTGVELSIGVIRDSKLLPQVLRMFRFVELVVDVDSARPPFDSSN